MHLPGTWPTAYHSQPTMPLDAALAFTAYAVRRFRPYQMLYSISGDTDFPPEHAEKYYGQAIDVLRAEDPDALVTLHSQPLTVLPPSLAAKLDFYTYQGGHMRSGIQHTNQYRLAQTCWELPGSKPVINTEPPYDAHAWGHQYERFGSFELRCAMWQSLLSGAHAGIGYGAHGLWSMHRQGQHFSRVPFSGQPLDWRMALRLEGAWEAGHLRTVWEQYDLFDLKPLPDLPDHSETIRMARNDRWDVLYVPYPCDIRLTDDVTGRDIHLYELTNKRRLQPEIRHEPAGTTLPMPQVNSDVVYLIRR